MRRLAALLVVLWGVSACEQTTGNVAPLVNGAEMTSVMNSEEPMVLLYCYPTLGQPDCYAEPLPGRPARYALAVSEFQY